MSQRIIYIEKCECLKLYLDNIKVIYNDNDILLPISDIQILVIDNYKSSLSIPLINKLTENNVCTVVCAAIVGLFLGAAMNDGLSGSILLAVIAGFVCVIYTIENSGKK